jgi:hypothetical protein
LNIPIVVDDSNESLGAGGWLWGIFNVTFKGVDVGDRFVRKIALEFTINILNSFAKEPYRVFTP